MWCVFRLVARKELEHLFAQEAAVDVRVHLCGYDLAMPQHCLYGAQVSSSLQEMGCKSVSKGVGRDGLGDPSSLGIHLDLVEDRDA